MTNEPAICRTLPRERIRSGLSVAELAVKAGVSERTLQKIEAGDAIRGPQMETVRKLAAALATTPAELLGVSAA